MAKPSESKQPPATIYLQWHGDGNDEGPIDRADVTWCKDRVYDNDVEYAIVKRKPRAK